MGDERLLLLPRSPVQHVVQMFKLSYSVLGPGGGQSVRDDVKRRNNDDVVRRLVSETFTGGRRPGTASRVPGVHGENDLGEMRERSAFKVLERLHHVPEQLVLACSRLELRGWLR